MSGEPPRCSFCGDTSGRLPLVQRPGWEPGRLICTECLDENYTERQAQLPPADELHAVRADIKRLASREAELKAIMISDPSARTGNAYVVEIREVVSNRTDLKELRAERPDWVDEHTYPVTTTTVVLRGINDDGELVSLRRKATA